MQRAAEEDSGGLRGDSIDVAALCDAHGWTRARLIAALRTVAARQGRQLPGDESLKRMIRLWINGTRRPSEEYAELLAQAFGVAMQRAEAAGESDLLALVDRTHQAVDQGLVTALEEQTQSLRVLDRLLGAERILTQAEAHVRMTSDLVQWAPYGKVRRELAATGAEAAALAGWQALDLGRPKSAWELHHLGRSLAQESGNAAVLAHVTAQQAYALLDVGRAEHAIPQVQAAREAAKSGIPRVLRAWLAAAEAEMRAAAGDSRGTERMLEEARKQVHRSTDDLPFIFLNEAHLVRWRGHCLARLGHAEAVSVLTEALELLDPDFHRAAAGLHTDLATAHAMMGDPEASKHHARLAAVLSDRTGSQRQRARLKKLIHAKGE